MTRMGWPIGPQRSHRRRLLQNAPQSPRGEAEVHLRADVATKTSVLEAQIADLLLQAFDLAVEQLHDPSQLVGIFESINLQHTYILSRERLEKLSVGVYDRWRQRPPTHLAAPLQEQPKFDRGEFHAAVTDAAPESRETPLLQPLGIHAQPGTIPP
jgi:hypothetical protein